MSGNCLHALTERGFIQDVSDAEALGAALEAGRVSVYAGYDPTASSCHLGHLVSMMLLRHLFDAGHTPIVLVGGATAVIGDPSGKQSARTMLTRETVATNALALKEQFARFFDFGPGAAQLVDNADWLASMGLIDFLRDVGTRFTVPQLLQHQTYRSRVIPSLMGTAGPGDQGILSFPEFTYALLQAYDFLYLHQEYGCDLQVGGSDQWFNILAGVDLIRKSIGHTVYGFTVPLIMTNNNQKMGKTESGAIWLSSERTSVWDYFQYWMRTADADVERFLKLFTLLPLTEIDRLGALQGADLRIAKEILAYEATALCHGEAAAADVRARARAVFSGAENEAAPAVSVRAGEYTIINLLVAAGLCGSRAQARRLVAQGGVYCDGARTTDPDRSLRLHGEGLTLRVGKTQYRRLVPALE